MNLRISKKHARGATRDGSTNCPVARALIDVDFTDLNGNVSVDVNMVVGPRVLIPSAKLRRAIFDWDRGKKFKLGVYRLSEAKK